MIETISLLGGLFSVFAFVHFFSDWIFQTNHEAINKHKDMFIRARHCTIYTIFFVPLLLLLTTVLWKVIISIMILWFSHYIIDTYIPVYLWAKHMRKIPHLNCLSAEPKEKFKELWLKPVYPILFIVVDQILHLLFLWPAITIIVLL